MIMKIHIKQVMRRYNEKCAYWDVVNKGDNLGLFLPSTLEKRKREANKADKPYLYSLQWRWHVQRQRLSLRRWWTIPSIAFRLAATADLAAELDYLEYGIFKYTGWRVTYREACSVLGSQDWWHGSTESSRHWEDWHSIRAYAICQGVDKGAAKLCGYECECSIYWVDIRMNTPSNVNNLKVQAECHARIAQSRINVSRWVEITLWVSPFHLLILYLIVALRQKRWANALTKGVSDKNYWVPNTFSSKGSALLCDNNYAKKPAYTSFSHTLQAAPITS